MYSFCLLLTGVVMGLAGPISAVDETHEGKVTSVTASEIVILDNEDSENDKFAINGQTRITRDGKPAKLTDIVVGDRAKVVATQVEGKRVAKSIDARSPE